MSKEKSRLSSDQKFGSERAITKMKATPIAAVVSLMVGGVALPSQTAIAQDAIQDSSIEEIVVTGIRSSLQRSQDIKRNSSGVVDAISAEDMGVFPDTNLAESLQRITGVSIDRTRGEGSQVTVRGFGPQFNLVTLNGRQMPTYEGRSFDFADLASESVAGVQIYKTGRADVPSGGIGASINIQTTEPLQSPGLKSVVAFKALSDTSTTTGSDFTPELSGIYSNTFADDTFGIAISASVQERDSGDNNAYVNGWRTFEGDNLSGDWGTVPTNGNQLNRPGAGDVYGVPQQTGYTFNEYSRDRINGQLTLQWQATESLRATADYTYSENEVATKFTDYSAWFNFGNQSTQFDGASIATPLIYTEDLLNQDFTLKAGDYARKTENESVGINLEWEVSDRLSLELDYHNSTAERTPASELGDFNQLAASAFTRDQTTLIIDGDVPVLNLGLRNAPTPEDFIVTGSTFENRFDRMEIDQASLRGGFDFSDTSRINFGVQLTEVNNRSASSIVQRNDWGGTTQIGDIADLLTPASGAGRFDQFGSDDPRRQLVFFEYDLRDLIQRTVDLGATNSTQGDCGNGLCPTSVFDTDRRTTEDTTALYVSYDTEMTIGDMPLSINAGLRYEETEVDSAALVPVYDRIVQEGFNEFPVIPAVDASGNPISDFTRLDGEYDVLLPNLDLKLGITDNLVGRFSYSETITRPSFVDIQGGLTIGRLTRVNGEGTGNAGNPDLLPFESKNIDISFEYYMNETDYAAIGYFSKDVSNFIGTGILQDQVLFPNLIHPATGVAAVFDVETPINQEEASVDGWEVAIQKTFGDTGFGIMANATFVDGDIAYDNASLEEQFVITGLSDSANLVGFYENEKMQFRVAYNWRDDFLDGTSQPNVGLGPTYVESYGQWDVRASYNFNDQLTFFLEGINVTDETTSTYGRSTSQLLSATQQGARYAIGARYSF
ncbi:MAG: TonB-dependent receptor [Gammaproteobacteria bacterium]|nr:TonB-dependent receptor [Gammaproteobacteria bacterium]